MPTVLVLPFLPLVFLQYGSCQTVLAKSFVPSRSCQNLLPCLSCPAMPAASGYVSGGLEECVRSIVRGKLQLLNHGSRSWLLFDKLLSGLLQVLYHRPYYAILALLFLPCYSCHTVQVIRLYLATSAIIAMSLTRSCHSCNPSRLALPFLPSVFRVPRELRKLRVFDCS